MFALIDVSFTLQTSEASLTETLDVISLSPYAYAMRFTGTVEDTAINGLYKVNPTMIINYKVNPVMMTDYNPDQRKDIFYTETNIEKFKRLDMQNRSC